MTFRRSPHLVGYWKKGECLVTNFRTGLEVRLTPDVLGVLQALDGWVGAATVAAQVGLPVPATRTILQTLVELSLATARTRAASDPIDPWQPWDPAAGFFHFSTRATRFNADVAAGERRLERKAAAVPPPAPTRRRRSAVRVPLPPGGPPSPLERVLRARRTWRTFSRTPVSFADLADLLRLSVGVQQWAQGPARRRLALKTSPSGGICHPIEAYVVATNVSGLARGIYHYDAAAHDLARLQNGANRRTINHFIQAQPWYGAAPVIILFTAVFERTLWRYATAKAYRNILLEAGHVCQTFYLLATERNLAPFCTQAIDEEAIDTALGLDGVREGVVYVAGCGRRPAKGWSLGLPSLEWWTDAEHAG